MKFFHGGPRGLKRGDLIVTARERGITDFTKSPNQPNYSPDFVYLTRLKWYAQIFAAGQGGAVYEVEPVGTFGPDPDAKSSFKCRRARVLREVVPSPAPWPQQFIETFGGQP